MFFCGFLGADLSAEENTINYYEINFSETTSSSDCDLSESPEMLPWIYCFEVSCCSFGLFDVDFGSATVAISDGSVADLPSDYLTNYNGAIEITPDLALSEDITHVSVERDAVTYFKHRERKYSMKIPAGKYPVKNGTIYLPTVSIGGLNNLTQRFQNRLETLFLF